MLKKLLIVGAISLSCITFASDTPTSTTKTTQEKIESIMEFYLAEAQRLENNDEELSKLKSELEAELEFMSLAKKEIELRTNLIKDLFIDIEDTKNLYFLEFDEFGNIKKEILSTSDVIKERLGEHAKIVKVRLKNGSILPLIKYKVQKNDTLKRILMKTYPYDYKPSWNEISSRIETLVSINKNVIKMNYIYPGQKIYVPIFKDNPSKENVAKNILKQDKRKKKRLEKKAKQKSLKK